MPLNAGSAFIEVFGDLTPLKTQMATQVPAQFSSAGAKAGSAFKGGLKNALGSLKGLGIPAGGLGALLGAAGIGAAISGLKKVADETAAYAGEVRKLKAITGASAEDASRLTAVLKALGIETSGAARPFVFLSDTLEKGGKGLKDYFTSAEIAKLRSQDLSSTVDDLADKYQSLTDPIEKNDFLIDSFGKRGATQMRALLSATDDEREAFEKLAEKQGLIFNDQQLKDAREYQIALRNLGQTAKGLEVRLGKIAIPALGNLVENINEDILTLENAGKSVGGVFEKLPGPIKRGLSEIGSRLAQAIPGFGLFFSRTDDEAKELGHTLDDVAASAAEDEEAAKKLGDAFKTAFDIADKAAQDFDKRLDELIPSFGDTFKDVRAPDEIAEAMEDAADKIAAANDRVADSEDRLADARAKVEDNLRYLVRTPEHERDLAEARRDVASAERDLADARRDAKKAASDLAKADDKISDALTAKDLKSQLSANAELLDQFATDIGTLAERFAGLETIGGPEIEEAFLAHLAELGPAAVPLLKELVKSSDRELAGFSNIFGKQIKAAKKAADFQFDKFPANFAEKIGAAREAASEELEDLIDEFQALPDKSDPSGVWGQKMDGLALAIQAMSKSGLIALSDVEEGFLDTALEAEDTGEKVTALQDLINSLTGKKVDVDVDIDMSGFDALENALNSANGSLIKVLIEPELLPPETDISGKDPKKPTTTQDLEDILLGRKRAAGGSVRKGVAYWVGEEGPEPFIPDQNGTILPAGAPITNNKTSSQHITIERLEVQDPNQFEEWADRKRRLAALSGV